MQYLIWVGTFLSGELKEKKVTLQHSAIKVHPFDLDDEVKEVCEKMEADGWKLWQEKFVITYT